MGSVYPKPSVPRTPPLKPYDFPGSSKGVSFPVVPANDRIPRYGWNNYRYVQWLTYAVAAYGVGKALIDKFQPRWYLNTGGWILDISCTGGSPGAMQQGTAMVCGNDLFAKPITSTTVVRTAGQVPSTWLSVTFYSYTDHPLLPQTHYQITKLSSYHRPVGNTARPGLYPYPWSAPNGVPGFNPWLWPYTPPPRWVVPYIPPGVTPDGRQVGNNPPTRYPPVVRPRPQVATQAVSPQPPGKDVKERKGKIRTALAGVLMVRNMATEFGDVVDALFKSLPKDVQDAARHDKYLKSGSGGLTFEDKYKVVYRNANKIDLDAFIKNIRENEIKDFFYGLLHGGGLNTLSKHGIVGGPAFGGIAKP